MRRGIKAESPISLPEYTSSNRRRGITFFSNSMDSILNWRWRSSHLTWTPFKASTLRFVPIGRASMYPLLRPIRPWSLAWTIPSIAACPAAPSLRESPIRPVSGGVWGGPLASEPLSSPSSFSSPIVGTVGRERPAASGAVVKGVFWGVGATVCAELEPIGTEDVPLMPPDLIFVALLSGSSDERETREKKGFQAQTKHQTSNTKP